MLQTTKIILLGLPLLILALYILMRVAKHYHKMPMPAFMAGVIDHPLRHRLMPPDDMARRHGVEPGMTVLEVGPGNGTYTVAAAQRAGPKGRVIALDIQPGIIRRVQERIAESGVTNLHPHLGDVYDLPYPDNVFDAAYMSAVIGEIPDPARAVAELHRVLKPGGTLSFTEMIVDPDFTSQAALTEMAAGVGFRPGPVHGRRLWFTITFIKPPSR